MRWCAILDGGVGASGRGAAGRVATRTLRDAQGGRGVTALVSRGSERRGQRVGLRERRKVRARE